MLVLEIVFVATSRVVEVVLEFVVAATVVVVGLGVVVAATFRVLVLGLEIVVTATSVGKLAPRGRGVPMAFKRGVSESVTGRLVSEHQSAGAGE